MKLLLVWYSSQQQKTESSCVVCTPSFPLKTSLCKNVSNFFLCNSISYRTFSRAISNENCSFNDSPRTGGKMVKKMQSHSNTFN